MRAVIRSSFAFVLLFCSATALAEDGDKGRLPDGRAFRTDGEGNQIVDYIAELELNVEAQQRRIHGLEEEVEQKNGQLRRYESKNPDRDDSLVERDLLGHQDTSAPTVRAKTGDSDCQALIVQTKELLRSAKEDIEIERQVHKREKGELEQTVTSLREEIKRVNQKLEELKVSYRSAGAKEAEPSEVSAAVKDSTEQEDESRSARASVQASVPEPRGMFGGTASKPGLEKARIRAVDSLRGNLQTEVNKLKTLVMTRDKALQTFNRDSDASFRIPSQPAVSKRNLDVGEISSGIRSAQSVHELVAYRRDIREIQAAVNDDLALVERMRNRSH